MRKLFASLATLIAICFASQTWAYSYNTCLDSTIKWSSASITMRASPRGFPKDYWRKTLTDAIEKVNLNPSSFRFELEMDTGGARLDNGQSEIWWSKDAKIVGVAPARAFSWWTCKYDWKDWFKKKVYLREVDIVFNHRGWKKNGSAGIARNPYWGMAEICGYFKVLLYTSWATRWA